METCILTRALLISVQGLVPRQQVIFPACPHPPGSCPPLSHPPLPRFPCTRCLLERGSESRAARLSYSIARHGGGPTTRLDFLSPFFLELWGYSGRTRLLHQRRSQEYNLAASNKWRGGNNRPQENSRPTHWMGRRIYFRGCTVLYQPQ